MVVLVLGQKLSYLFKSVVIFKTKLLTSWSDANYLSVYRYIFSYLASFNYNSSFQSESGPLFDHDSSNPDSWNLPKHVWNFHCFWHPLMDSLGKHWCQSKIAKRSGYVILCFCLCKLIISPLNYFKYVIFYKSCKHVSLIN